MLKNSNSLLPVCHDKKVYVPDMGENKALLEIIDRTYEIVTDPEEADFAIVFMEEPKGVADIIMMMLQKGGTVMARSVCNTSPTMLIRPEGRALPVVTAKNHSPIEAITAR